MWRKTVFALFIAIALLLIGYSLGRGATPRPEPVIPESAFAPVSVAGHVSDGDPDQARTRAPTWTPASSPSPEPSPPLGGSGVFHTAIASFFGPGLYGNRTACGQTLTPTLLGVASRTLRCGTLITFEWAGRVVTAPVVDRGPYVAGRLWDLTFALCSRLARCWTGPVWWRLR